jgi:acetyltransferase-like isoleucine patch superfamily enzyme
MDRSFQAHHAGTEMIGSGARDLPVDLSADRPVDQPGVKSQKKTHSGIVDLLKDPIVLFRTVAIRLFSFWVSRTYPFAALGSDLRIHYRSDLSRAQAHGIKLGRCVVVDKDSHILVHVSPEGDGNPILIIEDDSVIGPRCLISAKNGIHIESDVVLEPSVLIQDHSHAYRNVKQSIRQQGVTEGGKIKIGQGSWIGQGTVIHCDQGELTLGPNCVVAPNSLVNRSFPAYSLVAGNPAHVIKQFDTVRGVWVLGSSLPASSEQVLQPAGRQSSR